VEGVKEGVEEAVEADFANATFLFASSEGSSLWRKGQARPSCDERRE